MVEVKVKKLYNDAVIPTRGSDGAAGMDLYAVVEPGVKGMNILPGKTVKVRTGLAMEIPNGYFGAIFARSGLATRKGLRPSNCVGVIDQDYRGEVIVALHNDSNLCKIIKHGDRIAQIVIMPYLECSFKEVDDLNETERGCGGFGSTGVRG